ncbi:P-loop containing nucleoside triphosphate hydrolase protein [Rhizoclosmatium globosum]|uniref:p-loop containing nucleoside triphosphate hydrolase protein n=1 Tax=Rhizoclosmatium globosum TaxID=329046 RepID=A0A1Y2BZB5_9FUNG|nr:P-loop containing nucleoside triphosphate hydrolase protein [Rhizoclosmatium globosum]|eukprot:ORY40108.1 P-loop containing nucleoside triphosphate hydrolase protein [Rhizoclosmatium globosum]
MASYSSKWLDEFMVQASAYSKSGKSSNEPSLALALLPHLGDVVDYLTPSFSREHLWTKSGLGLALALFFLQLLNTVVTILSRSLSVVAVIRTRAALTSAIYKKTLYLSSKARKEYPAGKVNSLVSSDITQTTAFINIIHTVIGMPIKAICLFVFIWRLLGISTIVAAAIFFLPGAFLFLVTPYLAKCSSEYVATLDARTVALREFLYGIKIVKYNTLEDHIGTKIKSARNNQIAVLQKNAFYTSLLLIIILIQQVGVTPITLIVYGALGNAFVPSVISMALNFLNMFMSVSIELQEATMVFTCVVSYQRIQTFLLADEMDASDYPTIKSAEDSNKSIVLSNSTFTWESSKVQDEEGDDKILSKEAEQGSCFALENVSLSIKRGALVAVVGSTGSGKSSLLAGLAGTMRKVKGEATVYGSVAYCPQEPWILSGTIEENITLWETSRKQACKTAVHACALTKDLANFSSGLGTQIGEKGTNLSGGQRARIALARAIAAQPDIYLLDDPLSALDAHVGKEVFARAIKGPAMKNKTVLIATHLLHILPNVDQVLVMDGGVIVQNGTFAELMADKNGKLCDIMKDYHLDEETSDSPDTVVAVKKEDALKNSTEEKVVEDRETGNVTLKTYKSFFKPFGFHWFATFTMFLVVGTVFQGLAQLTLSAWSSNYYKFDNLMIYLYAYAAFSMMVAIFLIVCYTVLLFLSVRSSKVLHDQAMDSLLRAPISFFDSNPIGRTLNRMTKDMGIVDRILPSNLMFLVGGIGGFVSIVPVTAGLVVLVTLAFWFYLRSYRELKRLNAIMNTPIVAHISDIQAFRVQDIFISQQYVKTDQSNLSILLVNMAKLWVELQVTLLATALTLILSLFGIYGVMDPAFVGVALAMTSTFSWSLMQMLFQQAELDGDMVSVERLNHYAENLPREAPKTLPKDATLPNWPSTGSIEIQDLVLAYDSRPDHNVVNGISLTIKDGEKVGIVGRTGSGKSTLMDSLFRLFEAKSGRILIDGQDIATLGLQKARRGIQMIPQSPTLFDGTVRSNIDVLGTASDEDLWYALECCGMKEYVSSLLEKLDSAITEGGTNLSAGQRQLLCLAKVLLQNGKILVMDEATSSVDAESDLRIQQSMKTHFKDATVLSIAHRLNTIAAFDRVLVLDQGKVAEFEPPHLLLSRDDSIFSEMVNATGAANAAVIRAIAKEHFESTQV